MLAQHQQIKHTNPACGLCEHQWPILMQVQRLQEDLTHLEQEKHEHESTIIEQQDHIEKLQDSCQELQEAAQALQQDSDLKYAASIAQMKTERKQQVCSPLIPH